MSTDIKKRIERLEKQLAELKEKEKKGGLYVKQPEFENDFFFVENGFANVKRFIGNPRRKFGPYSVLSEQFNVDKFEECCKEFVDWIRAERLNEG